MLVLVLNPGSSSLKYQVRQAPAPPAEADDGVPADGSIDAAQDGGAPGSRGMRKEVERAAAAVRTALGGRSIEAVGHRVVHGGDRFDAPALITEDVIRSIEDLAAFAPLHNPLSVACIRAAASLWPGIPQVAVFDTAFHRSLPEYAYRYAVPDQLYREEGIRRYGFHGISVEAACQAAASFLGTRPGNFNAVIAHLGNGASVTAVRAGRSVDTSMGMTPLAGLIMGTRCGDIDPSAVTLLQRRGRGPEEIDELLNLRSGLQGLAGSADMRSLQDAADAGDQRAVLAVKMAAYRLAKFIGAYHVAIGGADALVFTGGIGEHSGRFRTHVLDHLGALGLGLDEAGNRSAGSRTRLISSPTSAFPILVVPTEEERAIAEATALLVSHR